MGAQAFITVIAIIGYFLCGLAGIPYFNTVLDENGITQSINRAGYALIIMSSVILWPFWFIYAAVVFFKG